MNTRLFKSFECRRLRVREPRLDAALGKRPMPAARADQEKLNFGAANAVTNGSHLLTFAQLANMRQPKVL